MCLVSLCNESVSNLERTNITGLKGEIGVLTYIDECGQQQGLSQSTSRSSTDYLPADFASENSILLKFISSPSPLF